MIRDLISGAIVMGYLVAALHFLKFWRQTRDRLFVLFAWAFVLLATQRAALSLLTGQPETHVYLYAARLLAFLVIIYAIIDKNRAARAG
jgi:hypothetical protein